MSTRKQPASSAFCLGLALALGACGEEGSGVAGPAAVGSLRVSVSTSGADTDPDGYTVDVSGAQRALAVDGAATIAGLPAGPQTVTLSGLAANCAVTGENPRTVEITANATAEAAFAVACQATTGNLQVAAAMSGEDPDEAFTLTVGGRPAPPLEAGATLTVQRLAPGATSVALDGVAANCVVAENPLSVTVVAGETATASFDVTCEGWPAHIVFNSMVAGDLELFAMYPDGGGARRLTSSSGHDHAAATSPDGSRIAFASQRDGNVEIYVMNADGSGQTRLTDNAAHDAQPAWSPDGSKIAFFSNRDGNFEVYIMNADGSAPTNLTADDADDFEPAWSPDGGTIVFRRDDSLYAIGVDGAGLSRLTSASGRDASPEWSPDGSRIAFSSDRDGDSDLYVMNADGSGITKLTNTTADEYAPTWSPDGTRIAYDSTGDGDSEIYVMQADGTGVTRLTNNAVGDADATWIVR